ncbi:MAG: M57 family metalloprotease [Cyclobacteriaceae bacterium]
MKKALRRTLFAASCLASLLIVITSCSDKSDEITPQNEVTVPAEVRDKLDRLGFNTKGMQVAGDGYLVEGDILITGAALTELDEVDEEHYRIPNLINCNGGQTITIYGNLSGNLSAGLNYAIANFNAVNTCFTFQRVYSSPATINVSLVNGTWAYSGLPSGGNPYPVIGIGSGAGAYGANYVECLFTHNIGHCIGVLHSDPFANDNSCPNDGGGSQYGAVHIPGTPTGPDPNSIFNKCACANTNTNGELSSSDRNALSYMF